ncbi:C39 family peptidase [Baaleninema simplex]|uniref:C39 family peptidase n=1 Tax=Baaleninema simplex TaxID=2862350 RepID=UPI00034B233E|nr:C39 family peptidase [Baaleninema simplex]
MGVLTYSSPQEILVERPTVLTGTYDPQQIAKVSVAAEDKYPLPVTLDPSRRTWQVKLDRGLNTAGVRWFSLKGADANGTVLETKTFYLTVSGQPLVTADSLQVQVLQQTWFKAAPLDSSSLDDTQKIRVEGGTTLEANRYTLRGNHIAVELDDRLSPVGTFGYLYQPHIQLYVGGLPLQFNENRLPEAPPGTHLLWITRDTKIKMMPESSTLLPPTQQAELLKGQVFFITGYACVNGHFRVTLQEGMGIPSFGNVGYLYNQHVRINKDGQWLPYDPQAVTVTILRDTPLKKRPTDSSLLPESEYVQLPATRIYGVASYQWEASHIKVALTENFPGFGNTGYLFPDFVEFKRGDEPLSLSPTLDYTGPTEVLVRQPTTLSGRFDPNQVTTVSVVAEDKHALPVTANSTAGTWVVRLDRGFQEAGLRWLRLKATNRSGAAVDHQIIYITVSTDPLTLGEELTIRTVRDTWFKVAPIDSDRLDIDRAIEIPADTVLPVRSYGYVYGHLQVRLKTSLTPVGEFGYFYEPHVQLRKGDRILVFQVANVPEQPLTGQLLVTETTHIKVSTDSASSLPANRKTRLLQGQTFGVFGYASIAGHFRVTLAESIPGFGNVGYVYANHVELLRQGKSVPYDPEALTITILQQTAFKRRPVESSQLPSSDKTTLPLGRVYGVSSYATEAGHIKAALTEELPGYGNTGYIFAEHAWVRRGSTTIDLFPKMPDRKELGVPYFSQRDNPSYSWATCNTTAIAMVFYYYGLRPTYSSQLEEELFQWIVQRYGVGAQTNHAVLSEMIRAYGYRTVFRTNCRWKEIDKEIAEGRPVILPGYFTATGHIVTVIGYTPSGLIVNDPWGNALTGYTNTYGAKLLYPNNYLIEKAGTDGNVWSHFIYPN